MPTKSPKEVIKVRRLPKQGQTVALSATVVRTDNHANKDTVTLRIPGYEYPITINADYLDKLDG